MPSLGAGRSPAPKEAFGADLARFRAKLQGGSYGDEERGRRAGTKSGDEEQEKALALLLRLGGHFRPQCGRFRGLELALFRLTRFEIGAVFSQKPPESPL